MPSEDNEYADNYYLFPIIAKLRKPLKALIPIDGKECLDLGISFRKAAGVSDNTEYFFGTPHVISENYGYLRVSKFQKFWPSMQCYEEQIKLIQ